MNRKFVSKSNRVLRKVLNLKENVDIIKDFIETFLDIQINQIILNPYLEKEAKRLPQEENFGIADVRVKLENNEELNVGIQFIDGYYIKNKMLLYYTQIHSNQVLFEDNRKISKTVTINILDFEYLNSKDYFSKIVIPTNTLDKIELYTIELPKFKVDINQNKLISKKEAWMLFLCGNEKQKLLKILQNFPKIKKLDSLLNRYWRNEKME